MVFTTTLTTISQCTGEFSDANKESIYTGKLGDLAHASKCFGMLNGKFTADPIYHMEDGKRMRATSVKDYSPSGKWIGTHVKWVSDPK